MYVFPFVCCLTAMATLQSPTYTFEVSASYCCFGLFVLVFEKIASQKLSLPEPYLVDLVTVLGHLYYEGSFLFLFIPTIDRSFKDGIVAYAELQSGYCNFGVILRCYKFHNDLICLLPLPVLYPLTVFSKSKSSSSF